MKAFLLTLFVCMCLNTAYAGFRHAQILIIGGGPAGIHAAATLLENGIDNFIILEGSSQLRGYLAPIQFDGFTFAPGSVWGYTPGLLQQLKDQEIEYVVSNYSSIIARTDEGEIISASEVLAREEEMFAAYDEGLSQIIDGIDSGVRPDVSQKVTLARGGWIAASGLDKTLEIWDFDWYDGVALRDISTIGRYRYEGISDEEYFILGDATIAGPLLGDQEAMLEERHVHYNQSVVAVNQTAEDKVKVITENGDEYISDYVIVTSTVGVLQRGGVTFDPPLPPWKIEEICRFQIGTYDSIYMKFDGKFWDDEEWILHANDRRGYYPAFLNLEAEGLKPAGTNILVGFIAGDETQRVELLTDDEVQDEIIEVLRGMYGAENVPDRPNAFYMSRFATDPLLYGNLATWPIGTNIPEDAQERLQAHIGRVYFAPEDASSEYITIPDGSVQSGQTAAWDLIRCIEEMDCDEYSPIEPKAPPLCTEVSPDNPTKFRKIPGVVP